MSSQTSYVDRCPLYPPTEAELQSLRASYKRTYTLNTLDLTNSICPYSVGSWSCQSALKDYVSQREGAVRALRRQDERLERLCKSYKNFLSSLNGVLLEELVEQPSWIKHEIEGIDTMADSRIAMIDKVEATRQSWVQAQRAVHEQAVGRKSRSRCTACSYVDVMPAELDLSEYADLPNGLLYYQGRLDQSRRKISESTDAGKRKARDDSDNISVASSVPSYTVEEAE